jgi:hypothetical protein
MFGEQGRMAQLELFEREFLRISGFDNCAVQQSELHDCVSHSRLTKSVFFFGSLKVSRRFFLH